MKKLLTLLLLAVGALAQAPLTNYPEVQFDQGTSIPGYCTIPGFYWYTTTPRLYVCNANHQFIGGQPLYTSLFAQTSTVTVANTNVETTLTGTGSGSLTLSANFFTPGTTIVLHGWGYHSATASPNITINTKLGSTVVATTGAVATNNSTNQEVEVVLTITCRTTGASGTLAVQGSYREFTTNGTNLFQMVNTSLITIDTTVSQTLDLTATWSVAVAGNSISITNLNLDQTR